MVEYAFVSRDTKTGDHVIEAHGSADEERNGLVFENVNNSNNYHIFNATTGLYLFVSNDMEKEDHVVEAHSSQQEGRNSFQLLGICTPF